MIKAAFAFDCFNRRREIRKIKDKNENKYNKKNFKKKTSI